MPEEQVYTIPLKDARKTQKQKRAARAAKLVKEFLKRHMKSEIVNLDQELNNQLWKHSAGNPPPKIRVKAIRQDDGAVLASLAE
ncbi:50S ribosomal protein L31 [candidate division MSBL1 archaeon SCGC-AAA261F17]|uniref:Large ribosomal subunit protein eL31 n=1 Tax=candidate division MSBL1 archaeon SCGC-AAA261F17 TaxID=1698274 RepID=A0A133V7E9_9EURY|nr:50S ribosomal protein L31 [candidate division MSBL1 archaeon SCGC-AAA261F17]